MELLNIEKLLEKYFEGATNVAEEVRLKEYFKNEEIAEHLKPYAPMFQYFSKAKEERFTGQLPIKNKSRLYQWASVAAAAVLTFGIYFGNEYREQQLLEREQAMIAYNETRKAFALLAENLNKGVEKVAYLNEFETTKEKIYNND
jgi:hypothetical protein